MPVSEMDPKSQLVNICQRLASRPLTKTDILYTTTKYGVQYQAIVKLNCVGGQEFAGELAEDLKQAERNAATQAVWATKDAAANLPTAAARARKWPLSSAELAAKKKQQTTEPVTANPAFTPKVQLNSLYMKIIKKFPQKGETAYQSMAVRGGFQASVQLAGLPGEWSSRKWMGYVCTTKQKAEQSAAEQALKQLTTDPELVEEANKKNTSRAERRSPQAAQPQGSVPEEPRPDRGGPFWMWSAPDCPEYGTKGGSSSSIGPRQTVLPDPITGDVVEWEGTYGFVKPHIRINHPEARRYGGKIYVSKEDIGGLESLNTGTVVKFFVYEDRNGLGGENVEPVVMQSRAL